MKLSISVPQADVQLLDDFARTAGLPSRSAAVQYAIRLLRLPDLEQDYAAAWQDWETSGDNDAWATTSNDGITNAAR
jgi:Arc/MetJ-type ribon-helix-helix transcriptional regulator